MTADKQSTSTQIILTNINWQVTNKKKSSSHRLFQWDLGISKYKTQKYQKVNILLTTWFKVSSNSASSGFFELKYKTAGTDLENKED